MTLKDRSNRLLGDKEGRAGQEQQRRGEGVRARKRRSWGGRQGEGGQRDWYFWRPKSEPFLPTEKTFPFLLDWSVSAGVGILISRTLSLFRSRFLSLIRSLFILSLHVMPSIYFQDKHLENAYEQCHKICVRDVGTALGMSLFSFFFHASHWLTLR